MKEAGAAWRVRIAAFSAGEGRVQGSGRFGPLVVWIWLPRGFKD